MANMLNETRLQIVLKKLVGRATTVAKSDEGYLNEKYPTNITTSATTSFAEALPNVPLRPGPTNGTAGIQGTPGTITNSAGAECNDGGPGIMYTDGVVECVQLDFIPIDTSVYPGPDGSNLQYHAYKARLPSDYDTDSNNPRAGTTGWNGEDYLYETQGRVQCIPPIFGYDDPTGGVYAPGDGTDKRIYQINVEHASGPIENADLRNWYFDYYNGIFFQERSYEDDAGNVLPEPTTGEVLLYIGDFVDEALQVAMEMPAADSDWWEAGTSGPFDTHLITTSSVAIGTGHTGITAYDTGKDTFFFVGGTAGSRAEWLAGTGGAPGVAHFGGDLALSGNLAAGSTATVSPNVLVAPFAEDEPQFAHIMTGSYIDIGNFIEGGVSGGYACPADPTFGGVIASTELCYYIFDNVEVPDEINGGYRSLQTGDGIGAWLIDSTGAQLYCGYHDGTSTPFGSLPTETIVVHGYDSNTPGTNEYFVSGEVPQFTIYDNVGGKCWPAEVCGAPCGLTAAGGFAANTSNSHTTLRGTGVGYDEAGFVAIRQICQLENQLRFSDNSVGIFTGGEEPGLLNGAFVRVIEARDGSAGDIELLAGKNKINTPPDHLGGTSTNRAGNINMLSGDGVWEGGDINIIAGGSGGTWTLEGSETPAREGGPFGGDISIFAGVGAYAGNIAIAGGKCNGYSSSNPNYFGGEVTQKRSGDVYIDGGNTESGESKFRASVLINTVKDPGEGPNFGPNGEGWCNSRFAEWTTNQIDVAGNDVTFVCNQKATRLAAMMAPSTSLNKILTACDYQNNVAPGGSWSDEALEGPFRIRYSYAGAGSQYPTPTGWSLPPANDLCWLIEWGMITVTTTVPAGEQWELRITKFDQGYGGVTGDTTIKGLADALFDIAQLNNPGLPNPKWRISVYGSPTTQYVPPPLVIPISLTFDPSIGSNNTAGTSLDSGENGFRVSSFPDPADELYTDSRRGLGVGQPNPAATIHITENGKWKDHRPQCPTEFSSPIAVDGLQELDYGALMVTLPDIWGEFGLNQEMTDLVYKLDLATSIAIIGLAGQLQARLGNDDGDDVPPKKSPIPVYTDIVKIDGTLVNSGFITNARYELDTQFRPEEPPVWPPLCPDGSQPPCDEPHIEFDPSIPGIFGQEEFDNTVMVDTTDILIKAQADANGKVLELILPSGINSVDATGALVKEMSYPGLGRVIQIKDFGGEAGTKDGFDIKIIPQDGELIDGLVETVLNQPYSSITLIGNGRDGWSVGGR